ncbi:MAG: hypothetical protein IKW12_00530 [Clostridia bacterium]|nr:hypothetical protein [Clostridia bacterium]
MKNLFKRSMSVFLCVCMILSVSAVGFASDNEEKNLTVSYADDLASLEFDVPVVFVTGLEGTYYKGLSTETEEDDVRIWGPQAGPIVEAVFKNLGGIMWNLFTKDYDELADILGGLVDPIFGDFVCDEKGIPNPDTGKKDKSDLELEESNSYENCYSFIYDWRYDTVTIAAQLDEYIEYVMDLTGSDKVALVSMSMGTAVMMTYLHEYYYAAEDYSERNHIDAAVFIAGAMNGVGCCEDPFSGNINIDTVSLMRFLSEIMKGNSGTEAIYYMLEGLYEIGALDFLVEFADDLTKELLAHGFNEAMTDSLATIPGFYALMSTERYEETVDFIFDTPEKKAKYSEIIKKGDYYHYNVQDNGEKIVQSLIDDGINTAIIAEYGYSFMPLTSDNDRMTDGTIATDRESFGATCSEIDGTLGEGYKQAKECVCGKNHVSADNQIDASTCKFADITWFGKYLKHTCADNFVADLVNLVIYSDRQITVWDYEDLPQFMINLDGEKLVPLTKENAGEILPYEETTVMGKFKALLK